jgi:hypothetical protein
MRRGLVALMLAAALPALAGNFPTRQGESGLLDVPDAQVIEPRTGMVGLELGFDHAPGTPDRFGPLPLSLGVGLGRFEWAVSARESGYPGDPRPAPMLFGSALKFAALPASGFRPAVAVDAYLDRFNSGGAGGGRLILSTAPAGPLRLTGFAGYERQAGGSSGLTVGLAAAARSAAGVEVVLEGLHTPRGDLFSGAVRTDLNARVGVGLVGSYLPGNKEYRIALAFGFHAVPVGRMAVAAQAPVEVKRAEAVAEPLVALGDRPLFKLRIRADGVKTMGEARHSQYAPWTPPALAGARGIAPPPRQATPSADDVVSAQLRDQALQAEARLKRLQSTDEQLGGDEATLDAEARKLDERERVLTAREVQLDSRERRLALPGAQSEPQRQLESQEAQLAASERQFAAQERGFAPTRDAALGTERDAQAREKADRSEADKLTAQADAEKNKSRQGDLRRQSLGARQRMLSAMEARVTARGERLEASTRQLRARSERLDAWQRRLELRTQRLDLLERQAIGDPAGSRTAPGVGLPLAAAAADKAVFVMVVKTPTAIMASGAALAIGVDAAREAARPSGTAEKSVSAAMVVTFASPTAKLSELDREAIDGIARLAARENGEVLVWARAKDPGLMKEANRRADELKSLVVRLGGLPPRQVVTRITTRPGAQGVDVVISALREGGKARLDEAGAPAAATLGAGETAKRQIRDAVLAVQPAIERCVTEQMVRRGLVRAEGSLKLTVSAAGRVTGASGGGGDLGGGDLGSCLTSSAGAWQFPSAASEYLVDVPITVVGGGAKP